MYVDQKFLVINIADLSIRQMMSLPTPMWSRTTSYYIDTYLKNESGIVKNTLILGYLGGITLDFNSETNQYEKVG